MSRILARLGRHSFTHPWRILLGWLAVVAGVVALLATQTTSMATGFSLDDTPSQQVLDSITREIPEARGAQGALVFTSPDGGRVDTPERAATIARAVDAARSTGYVVDRDAKLLEQEDRAVAKVTEQVEAKVAAELTPRLRELSASLDADLARLPDAGAAAGGQQVAGLRAQVEALSARAAELATAPAHERIAGASDLFSGVSALRSRLREAGIGQAPSAAAEPMELEDPRAHVDAAVATASAPVLADLDRLTRGSSPSGTPLTVGDRRYPSALVSADGTTAVASVQLREQVSGLPEGALDDVLAAADAAATAGGLDMSATSSLQPTSPPLGGHEAVGLLVAAVVLLLTLGSLVAAGLPILTALVGVFIGVGGAFAFSGHYVMTTSTPALGLMLGLAVGIDYALFVVHKHRRLIIERGLPARDSVALAVGTAGSAVVFAGLTVVIALLGLLTLGMPFVDTMAITAAVTVAVAVLIAVSALPALLGLVGERIVSPRAREPHRRSGEHRIARRWVSMATRRPLVTVLGVTALLALVALPAADLRLGMPSGAVAEAGSSQRTAYDATTRGFGEGANAPLLVTARESGGAFDQGELMATQEELAGIDGVVNVALMGQSPGADLAIFQVTPTSGPTAGATEALVTRLRSAEIPGLDPLGVSGLTAMNIDLSEALAAATPVYVGIVVLLSLVILLIVFRSLLVPVAATAGFLLTMAATAGLVWTAFGDPRWTWLVGVDRAGPVLSFLPVMATGILYGLANDYQLFLGTSMREAHVHGSPAREAVRSGFLHAGRVVVAAAVVMVSVFGGFVLSSDTTIRQFGFALSAGILIDAFLVRMLLMPAVLHLAGERAWALPRWLDRVLPAVDIEGDRLRRPEPAPGGVSEDGADEPVVPVAAAPPGS